MKRILVLISLAFFTNLHLANAQAKHEQQFLKNYVKGNGETSSIFFGLGLHVGIPMGNFGALDSASVGGDGINLSKLAGTGVGGGFDVKWRLGESFKLGLNGSYTAFGTKEETVAINENVAINNSGKASVIAAALGGEYSISRFFIGLDLGMYITKSENILQTTNNGLMANESKVSKEENSFGFAPKIGANFGNICVTAKYQMAGDTKFATVGVAYVFPLD